MPRILGGPLEAMEVELRRKREQRVERMGETKARRINDGFVPSGPLADAVIHRGATRTVTLPLTLTWM